MPIQCYEYKKYSPSGWHDDQGRPPSTRKFLITFYSSETPCIIYFHKPHWKCSSMKVTPSIIMGLDGMMICHLFVCLSIWTKIWFFSDFHENLHMDAHYITDYGYCKHSAFFSPLGVVAVLFFAVLATFINFYWYGLY